MAALFPEGFGDLSRRLRIIWLLGVRLRVRRAIFRAETELGWLGWEQVDIFDEQISAEVKKVQEFEHAQASLVNTSAELSSRKAALDKELAEEITLHDQTQASLAAERPPIAAQLQQAESAFRQKLETVGRFQRALDEIARLEKQLDARSVALMNSPEAHKVSMELIRLTEERKLVLADKESASQEAARAEPEIARLRIELDHIDSTASAARERLATARRRLAFEMRLLERKQKKSKIRMSHLDRKKRSPYRLIGACLADNGISPLNQPHLLGAVLALRERDDLLSQTLSDLRAGCIAANPGTLAAFYLLLGAVLFALCVGGCHFLHR